MCVQVCVIVGTLPIGEMSLKINSFTLIKGMCAVFSFSPHQASKQVEIDHTLVRSVEV